MGQQHDEPPRFQKDHVSVSLEQATNLNSYSGWRQQFWIVGFTLPVITIRSDSYRLHEKRRNNKSMNGSVLQFAKGLNSSSCLTGGSITLSARNITTARKACVFQIAEHWDLAQKQRDSAMLSGTMGGEG